MRLLVLMECELASGESRIAHEEAYAAMERRFPRFLLRREMYVGYIRDGVDGVVLWEGMNRDAGDVMLAFPLERIGECWTYLRFNELNPGISDRDLYKSIIAHEYGHILYHTRHEPAVDCALMDFSTREHLFLWHALNEGFADSFVEAIFPFRFNPPPPNNEFLHRLYMKDLTVRDRVREVGIESISSNALLDIARSEKDPELSGLLKMRDATARI